MSGPGLRGGVAGQGWWSLPGRDLMTTHCWPAPPVIYRPIRPLLPLSYLLCLSHLPSLPSSIPPLSLPSLGPFAPSLFPQFTSYVPRSSRLLVLIPHFISVLFSNYLVVFLFTLSRDVSCSTGRCSFPVHRGLHSAALRAYYGYRPPSHLIPHLSPLLLTTSAPYFTYLLPSLSSLPSLSLNTLPS